MYGVIAAALLSGLLLQLSAPPLEFWWMTFFALVPVLFVLERRAWPSWLVAGSIVGVLNSACLLDGGAKWGAVVSFFFVAFGAAQVALPFIVAGAIRARHRAWVFAAVWVAFVWLVDELLYTPVLLGAPLALNSPQTLRFVEVFGVVGLELWVMGTTALLVSASRNPRLVLPAALSVLAAMAPVAVGEAGVTGRVVGVQPNIHWSDFSASGWSLERRFAIETTLDRLTRSAVEPNATVVWPENGNGLANAQLERRRYATRELLTPTGADLLAPGREFDGDHERLTVFHFTAEGVAARVRKANLVPFAEAGLEAGVPAVVDTNAGRIGIAVCYDAMFSGHVRRLVDLGAELLVVTTDDTSFGASSIPRRHLSYAVLRAAEARRALLFVSNEGPSVSYQPSVRLVTAHTKDAERAVYAVDLERRSALSLAHRGVRHVVLGLALLVLWFLRGPMVVMRGSRFAGALAAMALSLPIGVSTDALWRASTTRGGLAVVTSDLFKRVSGYPALDGLGPMFKQSKQKSCGAAALAFVLTRLGDTVFEEEIASNLDTTDDGTTLAALARAAERRGFAAEPRVAERLDDLDFGPGIAHVLHLSWNHYVVVYGRHGDQVFLFDPALGVVLEVPIERIEQRWSGFVLRVAAKPVTLLSQVSTGIFSNRSATRPTVDCYWPKRADYDDSCPHRFAARLRPRVWRGGGHRTRRGY